MAYRLRALIAEKGQLERLARGLKGARVVELAESLGILPLTAEVEPGVPPAFQGLSLSASVAEKAVAASAQGPVAYVEADYTAGKDFQASVVWIGGKVSSGPLIDKHAWDPRDEALCERPINAALHLLGVSAEGFDDEWDAVGMARHRDTADWR